ncbi:MAG: winged helix-turn-helix domain-containing protein [Candidatus Omnitrophica bacterium]|nr:winged helix-turn-helix domain-containing protein [Candidatus Omnitrophota bacterium]
MSVIEVSMTAGEILSALEQHAGNVPVEQLTSSRRCSRDAVLMALGWLFKEGFVSIHPGAGDWWIGLRNRTRQAGH